MARATGFEPVIFPVTGGHSKPGWTTPAFGLKTSFLCRGWESDPRPWRYECHALTSWATPTYFFISFNLSSRGNFFISLSLFNANILLSYFSENTILFGLCDLVYFAPFPFLCFSKRDSKSLVKPVYKVQSSHSIIYTNHIFGNDTCHLIVGPPRIARGPAAYETAEVLLLHGPM